VNIRNNFSSQTQTRGGALFGAEAGYRFGGMRSMNLLVGLGVHFQKGTFWYNSWETEIVDRVWYRRTEWKVGVVF